jgi:spore coat protein A
MEFRVGASSITDTTTPPASILLGSRFGGNKTVFAAPAMRVRRFALTEVINNLGNGTELLLANRTWDDPPTEFVPLTTTEVWEFIGLTPGFDHPIHIHLIKFQVVSVQLINVTAYEQKLCDIQMTYGHPDSCFLSISRGTNNQELGWKDTVSAAYGAVTRIVIRFTSQNGGPFPFDATVGPGYIWHCHLLSHEDNSMMRPLIIESPDVQPNPDSFNSSSGYTG